jgi:hypothetical protein
VLFIQRDHVIEDLAAATSDPSFRRSVGQGCQLHSIGAMPIRFSRSPILFIR